MKKSDSFLKLLKFYGIFFLIGMGIIIIFFEIFYSYKEFEERKYQIEKAIIKEKKEMITQEVNHIFDLIDFERKEKIKIMKLKVRHRVYEAINIANYLYKKYYNGKNKNEIQKLILETLRPIRYYPMETQNFLKDVGYYFAVSMQGIELLFPDKPELEGKNMLALKNNNSRQVVRDMIEIAKNKGEGFYEYYWSKPHSKDKNHKKISFIKLFKPLNFFIGSGLYIEDVEFFLKNKIKDFINSYRFGKERKGYVFVAKLLKIKNKTTTIRLVNPNKPLKDIGKVIPLDLKDFKGNMFHKEMIDKALNKGEGFVTYYFKKFHSNKISKKITYVKYYPEWNWMIGAGVYLDDIEKEIAFLKNSLYKEVKGEMLRSILVIVFVVIIFILFFNNFSFKLKNDFNMFFNFFQDAIKKELPIDLQKIKFSEFLEMAESANKMLENKKIVDNKLLKEKEKLFITLHSIGDAVVVTDLNGKIELMNPVAEKLTGWKIKDCKGKYLEEIFKIINEKTREEVSNPVKKVLKHGKIVGLANHAILISKNGKEYNIADSAAPIKSASGKILGVILVFRDVTEKLKMEKEFLKIEKLSSLGILAGGLAHDFNNILTGVFANLELAMLKIEKNHSAYPFLNKSFKSLERAMHITQQLLLFSKGNAPIFGTVNLKTIIEETVRFNLSGSSVKPIIKIDKNLWPINADKGQISHLIANLVINASQAMPDGGNLYISCKNVELCNEHISGKFVKLEIKDEGKGIPKEYLEKIFEPYFTTKKKGSGLGLAIVYNIIISHNGYIEVESKEGEGTTFTIYLPAAPYETIIDKGKDLDNDKKRIFTGKVLIMDDEDMVREAIKDMLISLGFTVETASEGDEAIKIYKEHYEKKDNFDFVIMDLTVRGGKGGKDAIKEILKIDKNAKVIVTSGYSEDDVMSKYENYGFKGAIVKPFTLVGLKNIILKVLED